MDQKITDKIAALPKNANYFSLEFFPPKTQMGSSNLQARLDRMARGLRPLFVTVTWGAGGSTASKSLELAEICQRQLGLTTCLHLTCTNMNRGLIDEALEQAQALGIRNVLALRGDPPRNEEYADEGAAREAGPPVDGESNEEFVWAVDLVRYIRKKYGEYFCVGVAAYPEGHSDQSHPEQQDVEYDIPFLVEKIRAGADFIMTQLFYEGGAYERFEERLRGDKSGVFQNIPIIPGLMPIQSYQILRRTTVLSHAKLPPDILGRLDAVKKDDEAVKKVGVDILCEIVDKLKQNNNYGQPRGFHFYTLNLEKAVAHIVERCQLIPPPTPELKSTNGDAAIESDNEDFLSPDVIRQQVSKKDRRRLSSMNSGPRNRVIIDLQRASSTSAKDFEAPDDEAGVPKDKINSRANTLAISEGEGALGREATWDDYPNGRWGDARSPAFGEIDGYGVSLHVSIPQAIKLWDHPESKEDIGAIFRRHISGDLDAIPWSEEGLNPETATIREELLRLNDKGWWTVASQPAVNGVKSTDPIFGWGPSNGFVFQKPFVEFFLSDKDWQKLKEKLDKMEEVTYFAGNDEGYFDATDEDSVNPVTWGTFTGKEITTPTIIEAISFKAWLEEAFDIWAEWQRVYPPRSPSSRLLHDIRKDYWLVNVIHHDYVDKQALWDLLAEA